MRSGSLSVLVGYRCNSRFLRTVCGLSSESDGVIMNEQQDARRRINREIKKQGLTQRRISDQLGLSVSQTSRILSGKSRLKYEQVAAIGRLLGISPQTLVGNSSQPVRFVNVREAATIARRHPDTIRKAIAAGSLNSTQRVFGGIHLIEESDLATWISFRSDSNRSLDRSPPLPGLIRSSDESEDAMKPTIDLVIQATKLTGGDHERLWPETRDRVFYPAAALSAVAVPEDEKIRLAVLGITSNRESQAIEYAIVTKSLMINGAGSYSRASQDALRQNHTVRFRSTIRSVEVRDIDGWFVDDETRQQSRRRIEDSHFESAGRPLVHFEDGATVDLLCGRESFDATLARDLLAEVCKQNPGDDPPLGNLKNYR